MSNPLFEDSGALHVPALSAFNTGIIVPGRIAGVELTWAGEHFRTHLHGMEEAPTEAIAVRLRKLTVEACDEPMQLKSKRTLGAFAQLGGETRAILSVGQFWHVLGSADRSLWYVAYVRDKDGKVCGLRAGWMHGAGWKDGSLHAESGPYNRSYRWPEGSVFLSK